MTTIPILAGERYVMWSPKSGEHITEMICSTCSQICTIWGVVDGKVVGICCLGKRPNVGPSEAMLE